jgi:NADPH:quinone reductase-like Zn-dependent oxidoreductase
VKGLDHGRRVLVFPGFSCGTCEYCLRGERTVCMRYGYLGAARDGGYGEFVKVPAENIIPLPDALDFETAAAAAMTTLTSWHALVARAEVRPGQSVLVQAAGSGVGAAAIQIARMCHARVITTVGADHVVNYRSQDFVEQTRAFTGKRGVDVVIEHIGSETFERSVYCLSRLGVLVTIGSHADHWGRLDLRHVYSKNLRILGTNLGSILELRQIVAEMSEGRLRPAIDRTFPQSNARAAVQYLHDRKNKGKVLLVS